jgi:D-3-phosphoglycerate dehydrogenase
MKQNWTLILDFDSTVVRVESLDVLAEIALQNHMRQSAITSRIKELTILGMEGEITFQQSLQKRLSLLEGNRSHVRQLSEKLVSTITPSFKKNSNWLERHADKIFIFSGGFREAIFPVAESLGLHRDHVFANDFIYSELGLIEGVYNSNPFSRSGGKLEKAKSMKFSGKVVMVGDGNTDAELKELGTHVTFLAFTENVTRLAVVIKADQVVESFDDVIRFLDEVE